MASTLGSESRLHGGSFAMLSFEIVELVDLLEIREVSLLCRLTRRDGLLRGELDGLGASGRSSSMLPTGLLPAAQKQLISMSQCGCDVEHAEENAATWSRGSKAYN